MVVLLRRVPCAGWPTSGAASTSRSSCRGAPTAPSSSLAARTARARSRRPSTACSSPSAAASTGEATAPLHPCARVSSLCSRIAFVLRSRAAIELEMVREVAPRLLLFAPSRRFAGAMAKRLASLGALLQGDQRALGAAANLKAYDVDTKWAADALERIYSDISKGEDPMPGVKVRVELTLPSLPPSRSSRDLSPLSLARRLSPATRENVAVSPSRTSCWARAPPRPGQQLQPHACCSTTARPPASQVPVMPEQRYPTAELSKVGGLVEELPQHILKASFHSTMRIAIASMGIGQRTCVRCRRLSLNALASAPPRRAAPPQSPPAWVAHGARTAKSSSDAPRMPCPFAALQGEPVGRRDGGVQAGCHARRESTAPPCQRGTALPGSRRPSLRASAARRAASPTRARSDARVPSRRVRVRGAAQVPRFLNRLLGLPLEAQDQLFQVSAQRLGGPGAGGGGEACPGAGRCFRGVPAAGLRASNLSAAAIVWRAPSCSGGCSGPRRCPAVRARCAPPTAAEDRLQATASPLRAGGRL